MSKQSENRVLDGFTLVEVLISIGVFSIVMIGGFASLTMGIDLADNARHQTRSAQIMQSEIESVRSLAWPNLVQLPRERTEIAVGSQFNQSGFSNYTLFRSVSGIGNSRKITLEVFWSDAGGETHSKTYVTQYTKGGLYDYIN